ncbi:MAG TPA: amidohydrolase family protein [Drouetiella sp.]
MKIHRFLSDGLLLVAFLTSIFCASNPACAQADKWKPLDMIDIHAHIGQFSGFDIGTQTLVDEVQRAGVSRALVSNIDGADIPNTRQLNEVQANEITTDLVRKHPDLFRGLAWSRPEDGSSNNLAPLFAGTKDDAGKPIFVGIKFHPELNHFNADDPRVDPYLDLCATYNVPAVFHCGGKNSKSAPERIYNVAKRHPTVAVILYHMGFGTTHDDAIDVVKKSIKHQNAKLFLETAQAQPAAVLKAVNEVGAQYVLFGTDATYFGKGHYKQYQELIELLRGKLPNDQFKMIVHDNAMRIFRLY